VAAARGSDFHVCPVAEAAALEAALTHALGAAGVVRKRRHLYLHRRTRIHLDEVEGLGTFVELETVVEEQPDAEAQAELEAIAAALGLRREDAQALPYVELLARRAP
jgi:predicted adenylyl cyclase CyaB